MELPCPAMTHKAIKTLRKIEFEHASWELFCFPVIRLLRFNSLDAGVSVIDPEPSNYRKSYIDLPRHFHVLSSRKLF